MKKKDNRRVRIIFTPDPIFLIIFTSATNFLFSKLLSRVLINERVRGEGTVENAETARGEEKKGGQVLFIEGK